MRRLLLGFAVLGVWPAAAAASFGEVAFRPAGGIATCLRATGLPGELVRTTATSAQFLQAGPGGLTPVADVETEGSMEACPQATSRPNGMGVVAFFLKSGFGGKAYVRAALREPGGAWGPPVNMLGLQEVASAHPLAADVSARGDALVAQAGTSDQRRLVVVAARRASLPRAERSSPLRSGAFGAGETVFTAPKGASSQVRLLAGVSASGEAVLAWSFQVADGKPRELWAAIAAAGGPFAAPVKLGSLRARSSFNLAVADDGRALLAFVDGDDVRLAERRAGRRLRRAGDRGTRRRRDMVTAATAVRADGGAIVAWSADLAGDVQAVLRTQPGAFGAPVTIAPKNGLRFPKRILDIYDRFFARDAAGSYTSSAAGDDNDGGDARATITADGRAVVTWVGPAPYGGVWGSPAHVATIPLAGGAPSSAALGAELREAGSTTALTTADGTLGVAWADNGSRERDGRLHLALEGVPDGADPAPPKVTIAAPKRRVLAADEPLRLGVRCSAACDVRLQIGSGLFAPSENVSLTRAGSRRVSLGAGLQPLATLRGGPVTVLVRYAAPGARRSTAGNVTYHLRRLPNTPLPRVLGASARRDGEAIVVTWRTDRDAKASNFGVYATKQRHDIYDPIAYGDARRSGRTFRARIERAGTGRYVRIVAGADGSTKSHTTIVRVRG